MKTEEQKLTVRRSEEGVVEGDLELVVVDVHLVVVANAELVQEVLHRFRLDVRNGNLVPVVLHPDVGAKFKQRSDCPGLNKKF